MKTINTAGNFTKAVRTLTASALIASFVCIPTASSAGMRDRVQQVRNDVTELKNKVQGKVDDVKDKVEDLNGEGLEQLMETVASMVEYVKNAQAGYKDFVAAQKCAANSPCGTFRIGLRKMIESFINLPKEMPFMEHVPPAARQLEKIVKLVEFIPLPLLYASEKVLGNVFEDIQYRLELVKYAASQMPPLPTMTELNHASAYSSRNSSVSSRSSSASSSTTFPYCTAVLDTGKPHIELLAKSLEHLGDFLWDLADMMEENKTVVVNAVAGGGTSVKNPVKENTQRIGFVIKTIRQVVELKVAATASICAAQGYKAS
jgi:hypothetical protein